MNKRSMNEQDALQRYELQLAHDGENTPEDVIALLRSERPTLMGAAEQHILKMVRAGEIEMPANMDALLRLLCEWEPITFCSVFAVTFARQEAKIRQMSPLVLGDIVVDKGGSAYDHCVITKLTDTHVFFTTFKYRPTDERPYHGDWCIKAKAGDLLRRVYHADEFRRASGETCYALATSGTGTPEQFRALETDDRIGFTCMMRYLTPIGR